MIGLGIWHAVDSSFNLLPFSCGMMKCITANTRQGTLSSLVSILPRLH